MLCYTHIYIYIYRDTWIQTSHSIFCLKTSISCFEGGFQLIFKTRNRIDKINARHSLMRSNIPLGSLQVTWKTQTGCPMSDFSPEILGEDLRKLSPANSCPNFTFSHEVDTSADQLWTQGEIPNSNGWPHSRYQL